MLQKILQLKLDWDTQIPPEYCEHWIKFRNEIIVLKYVSIIRHVLISNFKYIELPGFLMPQRKHTER